MSLDAVLARIDTDLPDAVDRLMDLLRIQSVSTDPAYKDDCDRAADWLVEDLKSLGVDASKRTTPGHPMVVGHIDGPANSDGPHLMFYGHYDVQPIDPIELWDNDPFDPQIENTPKGQVIRGRGSSDDKGQLMTFVEACRAWKAIHGELPCKISFMLEGEEENWEGILGSLSRLNSPIGDGLYSDALSHPVVKAKIQEIGLPGFWRSVGWPERCQPVGEDDFRCGSRDGKCAFSGSQPTGPSPCLIF